MAALRRWPTIRASECTWWRWSARWLPVAHRLQCTEDAQSAHLAHARVPWPAGGANGGGTEVMRRGRLSADMQTVPEIVWDRFPGPPGTAVGTGLGISTLRPRSGTGTFATGLDAWHRRCRPSLHVGFDQDPVVLLWQGAPASRTVDGGRSDRAVRPREIGEQPGSGASFGWLRGRGANAVSTSNN